MNFVLLLIIATALFSVFLNSVTIENVILLILGTIGLSIYIKKNPVQKNYATYLVIFIVWVSAIFMPSFHLIESIMTSIYTEVTPELNNRVLSFGIKVFFVSCLSIWVDSLFKRQGSKLDAKVIFKPKLVSESFITAFILGCIALSIFCYSIGLGRMGSEGIALPFHLGGIINFFRSLLVPFLFAIFLEGYLCNNRKLSKKVWGLFIAWCIIEIFAWMSKSVIIRYLLPSFMLLYVYRKPSLGRIVRVLAPFMLFFLFMYPIIEAMRLESGGSLIENYNSAKQKAEENSEGNPILKPLNRTFMFGMQYAQDVSYIDESDFFDFSKLPLIVANGGAAMYQTVVIDGFPPTAIHSSGTCGIMDPLLHGGKGLVYIIMFLIFLLALYTDRLIQRGYVSIAVILIQLLLYYNLNENVSSLYDNNGFPMYMAYGISIVLAYLLNFKKARRHVKTKNY